MAKNEITDTREQAQPIEPSEPGPTCELCLGPGATATAEDADTGDRYDVHHRCAAKLARLTPAEVREVADLVSVGVSEDPAAAGVLSAVLQRRMNSATTRQGQDQAGADVLANIEANS